jgi:hypothetical protein
MKEGAIASEAHMTDFCHTHKFDRWFETSAKENKNIVTVFSFLVEEVRKIIFHFSKYFLDIFR